MAFNIYGRDVLALASILAAIFPVAAGTRDSNAARPEACPLKTFATVKATAVRDGRTVLLTDGRELRLAAIETPPSATRELASLTKNRTLNLKRLKPELDRYGRLVAFAFVASPDGERSLQQFLLESGHARVAARIGHRACAEWLLAAERAARTARRGLWADPNYAPLPADNPAKVLAQKGRFVLVEGGVLSVREAGSTIYVNFGRRWSRDFTVTIPKRQRRLFAAAGGEPEIYAGRRVRVRGVVERRSGPMIEVTHPEQIEFAD